MSAAVVNFGCCGERLAPENKLNMVFYRYQANDIGSTAYMGSVMQRNKLKGTFDGTYLQQVPGSAMAEERLCLD